MVDKRNRVHLRREWSEQTGAPGNAEGKSLVFPF